MVVAWRSRGNEGIKLADRECKRILREGEATEKVAGIGKPHVRKMEERVGNERMATDVGHWHDWAMDA